MQLPHDAQINKVGHFRCGKSNEVQIPSPAAQLDTFQFESIVSYTILSVRSIGCEIVTNAHEDIALRANLVVGQVQWFEVHELDQRSTDVDREPRED